MLVELHEGTRRRCSRERDLNICRAVPLYELDRELHAAIFAEKAESVGGEGRATIPVTEARPCPALTPRPAFWTWSTLEAGCVNVRSRRARNARGAESVALPRDQRAGEAAERRVQHGAARGGMDLRVRRRHVCRADRAVRGRVRGGSDRRHSLS